MISRRLCSLLLICSRDFSVSCSRLLGLTADRMSEGESKQGPDSAQEGKPEPMAAAPTGQGVASVSPPVSMVTQPPATAATEDEEEESEDESEILEESPCGRWQKRREEVGKRICRSYPAQIVICVTIFRSSVKVRWLLTSTLIINCNSVTVFFSGWKK